MGVSGGGGGFSASLKVDVNTFKESINEGSKFMSDKTILTAGGPDLPEPIRVRLILMYEAIHYNFFKHLKNPRLSGCDSAQSMAQKGQNVKRMLAEYPNLKGAILPEGKIYHKLKVRKEGKIRDPVHYTPKSHFPLTLASVS